MKYLLEDLLFPPGLFVVLGLAGLWLLRRHRRAGLWLLGGALGLLYVLSLPVTAAALLGLLQAAPALTPAALAHGDAQAIVVLAAGRHRDAPEYGGDTVSALALERLRYGVHLHRATGLPLVLAGGTRDDARPPEARLLRDAATGEFAVPVLFTEERSRTTWENAVHAAPLLRARGIGRIYLVTHAWHMPRARWSFERAGVAVTAAPTAFVDVDHREWQSWLLPSARALALVRLGLHEAVGLVWYRLRA